MFIILVLFLAVAFSQKTVLLVVADGSEDTEVVIPLDILRRGAGENSAVTLAKVGGVPNDLIATCELGTKIVADIHISNISVDAKYDAIVVPGGMGGSVTMASDPYLIPLLKAQKVSGRILSSICAAGAIVLGNNGLLDGVQLATTYPALWSKLPGNILEGSKRSKVNIDYPTNVVTSQTPGTAIEYSLNLVMLLWGKPKADEVRASLHWLDY